MGLIDSNCLDFKIKKTDNLCTMFIPLFKLGVVFPNQFQNFGVIYGDDPEKLSILVNRSFQDDNLISWANQ